MWFSSAGSSASGSMCGAAEIWAPFLGRVYGFPKFQTPAVQTRCMPSCLARVYLDAQKYIK